MNLGGLVSPVDPWHTAVGAAFTTFTTRQSVSPLPLAVIQGGTLRLGQKIRVTAEGEFSTTGTPTLSIGVFLGTVAGSITHQWEYTAAATGSGAAAWPWRLHWLGLVTGTLGTTTTVVGQGYVMLGTSLVAFGSLLPIPSTQALRTVATVDTTIARAVGICATWGTSSASNSITTNNLAVELVN
jgi:hypothetical protein